MVSKGLVCLYILEKVEIWSAVLYEQNTRPQIWLLLRARALLHVPTWTWSLPTAWISVDISLYMFFHQFRILSFKNVFSWAFQLPYLFSVNLLTNCSHKSQFFIFCFWRKIQPNIWPIHPRPQFLFPFWNQRIFDLCCSHWRLIYLPHQIRSEVHHELQILPNTKLGDKNRSPPGQILRRMGYICPRPWRGLVKLKISWISNIKRNYHRSENEPLTDSYHEHFYVEKGFKVSGIDQKLAVLESVEILKPPFMVKLITVRQELGLELLKKLSILRPHLFYFSPKKFYLG